MRQNQVRGMRYEAREERKLSGLYLTRASRLAPNAYIL